MKLKQYPKYKESKVDFLGNVPVDWNAYRLKFLLSALQSGKRELEEEIPFENGAFSLGGEHVNWDGTLKLDNVRLVSEEFYDSMNQGKIKINDVLLVKDGATIGKTALVKKKEYDKMCVNEHVFILRPNKKLIPRLLYYLVYSDCGFSQIKLTETGSAQGGVNSEFTSKLTFSISEDSKEQTQIADFLDKKTTEINNLLEKDKRLIELLKEKRIALINHVVTKGLNPKTKFKDSGIDWIDKIPEGWEVVPMLKFLESKIDYRGATPEKVVEGVFLVTGRNVKNGKIDYELSQEFVLKDQYKEIMHRGKPQIGDLLFTTEAPLGEVANVDNETVALAQRIIKMRGQKDRLDNYYLKYYIMTALFQSHLQSYATGSTALGLKVSNMCFLRLILPSLKEQAQIVEYLDKATSKIDETVKKIENRIELLEEYKKSLIHNVVNGKVNVQGGDE